MILENCGVDKELLGFKIAVVLVVIGVDTVLSEGVEGRGGEGQSASQEYYRYM